MAIISRQSRRRQLESEMNICSAKAISHSGEEAEAYRLLAWEIRDALMEADIHGLEDAIWRMKHPACHDHQMRHCPICHRQPEYIPEYDHEAPAVQ